jgi:hypothetical protein
MTGRNNPGEILGKYDQNIAITIGGKTYSGLEIYDPAEDGKEDKSNAQDKQAFGDKGVIDALGAPSLNDGKIGVHNGIPYYAWENKWRTIFNDKSNGPDSSLG